jgi:hypothetical protein
MISKPKRINALLAAPVNMHYGEPQSAVKISKLSEIPQTGILPNRRFRDILYRSELQ